MKKLSIFFVVIGLFTLVIGWAIFLGHNSEISINKGPEFNSIDEYTHLAQVQSRRCTICYDSGYYTCNGCSGRGYTGSGSFARECVTCRGTGIRRCPSINASWHR